MYMYMCTSSTVHSRDYRVDIVVTLGFLLSFSLFLFQRKKYVYNTETHKRKAIYERESIHSLVFPILYVFTLEN